MYFIICIAHCALSILVISLYTALLKKKIVVNLSRGATDSDNDVACVTLRPRRSRSAIRIRIDRKTNDKTMVAEHVVIVVPCTRYRVDGSSDTGLGYRVRGRPPVRRTICRSPGVIVSRTWTGFERRTAFVGENSVFEKNVFADKNENYFER